MLIGILSDTHFGLGKFYDDSFSQGEKALETACSMADIVIVAGDIFDMRVPRLEVLGKVIEIFRRANKSGKEIFGISGTHERRAAGLTNPVEILEKSGVLIDLSNKVYTIEKNGEKVTLVGLGGVPDEQAKAAIETLSPLPEKGHTNVFVFHQTITDFVPTNGIRIEDLPEGFDLYVCGHIHEKKVKKFGEKLLIIPGSTVITQLRKEECDEKGIFLYDTKTKNYSFVPIPTRKFIYKEILLANADNFSIEKSLKEIINEIKEEIGKNKEKNESPIVKIKLIGNIKEGLRREDILINVENHGFYYFEVENALDTKTFKEEMEILRKIYNEKKNAKELGLEILKKKMKEKNYELNELNVEKIFEKLSEEKNIDDYLSEILGS